MEKFQFVICQPFGTWIQWLKAQTLSQKIIRDQPTSYLQVSEVHSASICNKLVIRNPNSVIEGSNLKPKIINDQLTSNP